MDGAGTGAAAAGPAAGAPDGTAAEAPDTVANGGLGHATGSAADATARQTPASGPGNAADATDATAGETANGGPGNATGSAADATARQTPASGPGNAADATDATARQTPASGPGNAADATDATARQTPASGPGNAADATDATAGETANGGPGDAADATDGRPPRRGRALLIGAAAVLVAVATVVVLTAAGKPAHPQHQALKQAPAFSLPELGHSAQRVSLSAYAGKPVIVNFFASWCAPCKRETPLLASFYRAHHGQVLIIGVDSNDETPAAEHFVKAEGVTYPVGFDAYPALTATSYGIIALPQTYLLNAKHQIVRHISGDVTQAELTAWAASLSTSAR